MWISTRVTPAEGDRGESLSGKTLLEGSRVSGGQAARAIECTVYPGEKHRAHAQRADHASAQT